MASSKEENWCDCVVFLVDPRDRRVVELPPDDRFAGLADGSDGVPPDPAWYAERFEAISKEALGGPGLVPAAVVYSWPYHGERGRFAVVSSSEHAGVAFLDVEKRVIVEDFDPGARRRRRHPGKSVHRGGEHRLRASRRRRDPGPASAVSRVPRRRWT